MKYYLASGFNNKEKVQYVSRQLSNQGWSHTYDWTNNERADTEWKLKTIGEAEVQGILEADLVVVLLPGGAGTHVEIGLALGYKKDLVIWSETGEHFSPKNSTTFYFVDGVHRLTCSLEELITLLSSRKGLLA